MITVNPIYPSSLHAPAKVNLFLHITGRRDDGYHKLDTGIIFTKFGDRISIKSATTDEVNLTGPFANLVKNSTSRNICVECLEAFRQAGGVFEPIKITIHKNIPVGAGLGGGSTNAAALLRYLNQHSTKPLTSKLLKNLALNLGADVPVCLTMKPSRVTGIGEKISPLKLKNFSPILLANSGKILATADVFQAFAKNDTINHHRLKVPKRKWTSPTSLVEFNNDLEKAACLLDPKIIDLMSEMRNQEGALAVGLSGSGATCFAIYEDESKCVASKSTLERVGYWSIATTIMH